MNYLRILLKACLVAALTTSISSCGNDSAVVWQAQVASPDGARKAVGKTEQFSGLGTAAVYTTVSIARSDDAGEPVQVLVLSNPSANPASALIVDMSWRDPEHLDLSFDKSATPTFKAVLYGDVAVSSNVRL